MGQGRCTLGHRPSPDRHADQQHGCGYHSQAGLEQIVLAGPAIAGVAGYGLTALMMWMMPNAAENEPFSLTEGISAWPTATIRLLALVMSSLFSGIPGES